ncbi:unnamed protein product [Amoebophrya sp. A25]|nr:unnamed protein product [Amoebophrya sp. A25]|eukprot:GSA25T00005471001.1
MRVPAAKSKAKGGSPNGGCGSKKGHWRFSMSPCGTCTEIYYGQSFEALQTEAWYLRESARMTPQVPVMFEFSSRDLQAIGDYLPAAYKRVGSRWQLRNGVGPESLELFKGSQWRLPAGQFKVLLPGGVVSSAPALSGTTKGGAGKGHSKGSDHTSNVGKSGGNKKPVGVSDIPIGEMAEFLRLFWEDDTGLNEKEVVELGSVTEDGALYVNKPILSCVEYRDALLRKLDSGTT